MAGTNPSFDATAFTEGIRFAMKMGAPVDVSDQATFIFAPAISYPSGTRLDREGRPLDPTVVRTESVQVPPTRVDCAIEFKDAGFTEEGQVGRFAATRLVITLFETDYQTVKDAKEVLVGGDRYVIAYSPPPVALFQVGFRQIVAYARDET